MYDFFAWVASKHGDQKRKYDGEPYICHLLRVANKMDCNTTILAAISHDILEDTDTTEEELLQALFDYRVYEYFVSPIDVIRIVKELTDEYTEEKYPNLNRRVRKKLEAERLKTISIEAAKVKIEDTYDNLLSISKYDPDFAALYKEEKEMYYPFLIEKYGLEKEYEKVKNLIHEYFPPSLETH